MDLSSAIDWWDEWKLRIRVLCSLFVQSFLLFSMYVRTVYALRRLRVLVWIAYIGGDALAIYALATRLFNRQKQHTAADGGGTIEVIWAPVLLIHLGGQPTISAYSLEDNELWRRHIITLVSQVTVALYVFCKWWSGEKRLLLVAIFLFIIGILKFSQKPWALRRASYANITSTYLSSPSRRVEGSCCTTFCTGDFCDIAGQLEDNPVGNDDGIDYSLEEYVEKAQEHVKEPKVDGGLVLTDIYRMFVDLAVPYSFRLRHLQWFINLDKQSNTQLLVHQLGKNGVMIHHHVLRGLINVRFLTIYTRMRSSLTCLGSYTNLLVSSLDIASLVLFAKSNKDGYNRSDISVTYILLFGRIVMENAISLFSLLSLPFILCFPALREILSWQDMVAQHIMSFCARKKKRPTLMKLATFSNLLRDYINKYWYIRYQSAAQHICVLVRRHVEEDGWKKYISDAAMYRRFNSLRGEHTLKDHHLLEELEWTFNLPFDEYVLVWHLATDLCIHQTTDICIHQTTDDASASVDAISSRNSSEIISNYMIYLLFICPEMLIPGARQDLFIHACDAIEHIIKDQTQVSPLLIAKKVYSCMGGDERGVIYKACRLAKVLIDLNNNTEMWEVIQGMWVEMLCYSASRCRGYLHAKSLGVAGEFLTSVWLLWWCMGMQTLPDMMHQLGPTLDRSQANKCTQPDKQEEEEELTPAASV